ncbi:SusD/RagB family nutrient-binding outer membrane lipoprotein [uncultured Psychroserpens sp.]|uniref:SusD/RagB family nutrient-binding outer membrane lipoprotein n=1 Tax=uncultured Psychroserpens sp. TaxID=255436 RepID=UPI002638FDA0|nr:SusD/RagB family nutrient-binding outer membrane lipoprotein [uncultured Psychroserpens sp.]
MKTIKIKLKIAALALLFIAVGCETADLEQLADPSNLTPESADPQLLINNVQIRFMSAIAYNEDNEDGLNVRASEAVRMQHLFGAYSGPFSLSATSQDDFWEDFYKETLIDIKSLIPIAEAGDLKGVVGVAKVIQAYTYVTLVDTYGNVPFTQALDGNENDAPAADDGQDIYTAMLDVIDDAISDLSTPGVIMPTNDLFYGGDAGKWIKAARTLKFKMYAQMRLVGDFSSEINTLISQGIIEDAADDLQFQYSTSALATGDSRHPYYSLCYDADGSDDYMNNYYMFLLKDDKGFNDPRLRYYFYRQIEETPTGDDLECEGEAGFNFCHIGDFYWGRDHGDDDGVPPDQLKRTTYGLYPIGGAFDADNFQTVINNPGAAGAGIFPLMLSSYVKFLRAESALMSGTTGNPRTLFEEGVRASMTKVLEFNPGQVDPAFAATQADVDNYVTFVLGQYDAAADNEAKLDVIMKEYYIALWGNGIEAWNNYRRTSYPSDLEPHVNVAGEFPRTFMYPAVEVSSNESISQKQVTEKVFWDTNPDNLQ